MDLAGGTEVFCHNSQLVARSHGNQARAVPSRARGGSSFTDDRLKYLYDRLDVLAIILANLEALDGRSPEMQAPFSALRRISLARNAVDVGSDFREKRCHNRSQFLGSQPDARPPLSPASNHGPSRHLGVSRSCASREANAAGPRRPRGLIRARRERLRWTVRAARTVKTVTRLMYHAGVGRQSNVNFTFGPGRSHILVAGQTINCHDERHNPINSLA